MKPALRKPDVDRVRRMLEQGLIDNAEPLAAELVKQQPQSPDALRLHAEVLVKLGLHERAAKLLEQCLTFKPGVLSAQIELIRAYFNAGRLDEAAARCQEAMLGHGRIGSLVQLLGLIHDRRNDYAAAWAVVAPALEGGDRSVELVNVAARSLHGLKRYDEAASWARSLAEDPRWPADARRFLWLHVAKSCDAAKRYDEAMQATAASHALAPERFLREQFLAHVDSLIGLFSPKSLRMLARSPDRSELPVFVIGMPRSGTTLVEQIIHAHPQAFGAGELADVPRIAKAITRETGSFHAYPDSLVDLTPKLAGELAGRYLDRLRELSAAKPSVTRVVNKALEMYEHVGLIWMLFPGARIIHCRRDPLDTCLSCYTRHLNSDSMPYATSLANLGLVHRQHERLMDHWKAVLDLPILTVQYEEVVADQEAKSREIIKFLGLPWDDRCLRYYEAERAVMTLSYDQVNKPIYDSSIGRWRNYEKHLGPLKEALGLPAS